MFSSFFSFSEPVHCEEAVVAVESSEVGSIEVEEKEAAPVEEEEDEEEPEDLAPGIREECAQTKPCANFKHHLDECTERVLSGKTLIKGEDCVEELFHFMHCVDDCSAAKVFASLK